MAKTTAAHGPVYHVHTYHNGGGLDDGHSEYDMAKVEHSAEEIQLRLMVALNDNLANIAENLERIANILDYMRPA